MLRQALSLLVAITFTSISIFAQNGAVDTKIFDRLEWRSIGPANMGGRTADVEGVPGNPNIVYVGTASGGVWKTTNGGVTWKPIFERQGTLSVGDIALQPGNPDVVWVGTGEANPRNSVSFGDGVYKSTDGGRTWNHVGLKDTRHIARILIHPTNPDIAYVGALGHAFGPNDERGVFMTTDGGKTWAKTLFIDNEHGISDMEIDASNPNILYAAVWRFERKPWTFVSGSEKGGVYKSIDGGRTWNKLTNGLPKLMGRIGVKAAPSNPNVMYVIAETKEGTMFRSDDKGETWRNVSKQASIVSRGFYYTDVRVDPLNENRVYAVASTLFVSIDGGRTYRAIAPNIHIDYHAMWIDPQNPKRMWTGQDGGVAVSHDHGESWEYVNNMPLGQFYHVFADNRQPFYYVMGGLQDNGSWSGPSRNREPAGILNDDWRMVSFGDGFKTINHADDPELYLSLSQGGNISRTDMRTREQQTVKPYLAGAGGAANNEKYRFNWNAPLIPSPHDKNTVYLAGNVVFKSTDFGKTWTRISDDLTTNDPAKLKDAGGPIAPENTTAEYHSTIISLEESPIKSGVLWAGSDDGNVQVTTDGGKKWENVTKNVKGIAANSPVSHVEPSRTNASTAYVAFDRHMFDDVKPYIFKTTDGGKSFTNITGNLPETGYVHVVREDPKNPNLLYAGTELGLWASYNGGSSWVELNLKNLPKVAVHDVIVHPRDNDLIIATHGRSVWILDDATPIQKMNSELASKDAHLFEVRPALRFTTRFTRYGIGDKVFAGPNPPSGALVYYYLKDKPDDKTKVKLEILDAGGKVIAEVMNPPKEKGLNRAVWNLALTGPKQRRPPPPEAAAFGFAPRGPLVLPGIYTVRLSVGDKTQEQKVEVKLDPTVNTPLSDLQAAHEHSSKVMEMISNLNQALLKLDALKAQLEQTEKTLKANQPDAPKDVLTAISDGIKQMNELSNKVSVPPSDGLGYRESSKLSEKLSRLFSLLESANAAPTPAMKEFFAELQPEYQSAINELNLFLANAVPKLNDKLKAGGAPTLILNTTK
ncbi:MAG TPA: hypothetical protein VFZ34_09010 [Blastocatellia bacterium]|nr:hypothetical protein [Blastocatellia bacterium]